MTTFYVRYRGNMTLYTPIQASSEKEAYKLANELPDYPTNDMELLLPSEDFDFYLDTEYVTSEINFNKVNKPLNNAIIKTAINQGAIREQAAKEFKIANLTKQIDTTQAQLLTVTKGITDHLDLLNQQLNSLKGIK